MMQTSKKTNHISVYRHYLDCCERMGIVGVEDTMNRMLVLDFLIVNEDRHLNNFGVIRRADTLEYIGAAPVYDRGTSLWFDKPLPMINAGASHLRTIASEEDARAQMITVTVPVWHLSGNRKSASTASVTVNRGIADAVKQIFQEIYDGPQQDPYSFSADSDVVKAFKNHGFSWGGDWSWGNLDYMHFSYFGT